MKNSVTGSQQYSTNGSRQKERKKEHRSTTMQKSANEEEYVRVLHIAQKTAKNTKPLPRCRSLQMKMKK